MNVYLIGYRCTGKSSVGRILARRLGWPFVDTDRRVVARAGRPVADIVARGGWPAFRELERTVMRETAAGDRQVVATGGGVPCDRENRRLMAGSGTVVWLRAAPAVIAARLAADTAGADQRPALDGGDALSEVAGILSRREPLYRGAAHLAVDTDDLAVEAVAVAVLNEIEKKARVT